MSQGQLGEVGQLLHLDDGVVEGRLQALGHHVGQDDGHHHGQDVGDLARQLEADHRRGHGVGDRTRHGRRSWGRKGEGGTRKDTQDQRGEEKDTKNEIHATLTRGKETSFNLLF